MAERTRPLATQLAVSVRRPYFPSPRRLLRPGVSAAVFTFGAALAGAAACGSPSASAPPQEPVVETRPRGSNGARRPMESGVTRLGVQCVITSRISGSPLLQKTLCERLAALAAEAAPVPVKVIERGDPAMLQQGALTLMLDGAVHPASSVVTGARGQFLAFTVRPYRAAADDLYFGTPIRVASLQAGAAQGQALDAALTAVLAETLPWRTRQAQPGHPDQESTKVY